MSQLVYRFAEGMADGTAGMKNLLGGKGANLAEMCHLGLPVPPGFTISTEVCADYMRHQQHYPDGLREQVGAALRAIEEKLQRRFGDAERPLLVSVRSGARVSMPGMMDTVLNLGLNRDTVAGLARLTGDARFAADSYRRFIQMYGSVVLDVPHHAFEDVLDGLKRVKGYRLDTDLTAADWQLVIDDYLEVVQRETGQPFPQDVTTQLWGAIGAVFQSWQNPRAITYRRLHQIPADWGTAVTVQAMVFGNLGDDCCTGVAFTRNPSTGENRFFGEYLVNAQGEDVVAGIRTPLPLNGAPESMEARLPAAYAQLCAVRDRLERHYRDMQDLEFTVQQGKLYMLQTRNGKRSARAALTIAVAMVGEGVLTQEEAIARIEPAALDQLLHPTLDPQAVRHVLARGLPASPGAAFGHAVFDADTAEAWAQQGRPVILCRQETSPDDIHGMHAAAGIITARGGMTSHAAVVARGMGRSCVVGAGDLAIDAAARTMRTAGQTVAEGDLLTIDGATGDVMLGRIPMVQPDLGDDFAQLMRWADGVRRLGVLANADTPADAETARRFGAEGLGLCRTEHMFFDPARIGAMRAMILADNEAARAAALAVLEPMQRADFVAIFKAMAGLPVTIRLLDPPLHEFLPRSEADLAAVAAQTGRTVADIQRRTEQLHEANPMLGHRGCRLAITYPEIYQMQVRAILQASLEAAPAGPPVPVDIMVPLIATGAEMEQLRALIEQAGQQVQASTSQPLRFRIGTMIELPRAALCAEQIARHADFFSFGTNDLTQTTLGISRDDAGSFLAAYQRAGIFTVDPFVTIDVEGVGALMRLAIERGRQARPELKVGVCGEHGGDTASIHFFARAGLNYVSCSPWRVPVARLAAAQAALRGEVLAAAA